MLSLSISDTRFQALRAIGYTGSMADMDRQRLLSVLALAEPVNLSLSDLYQMAGEVAWPEPGYQKIKLFSDSFNRADGPLGAGWTQAGPAAVQVVSNQAGGPASYHVSRTTASLIGNNGYSQVQVSDSLAVSKGLFIRMPSTGVETGYLLRYNSSNLSLFRFITGAATSLSSYASGALVAPYTLRLEADDTSIRGYLNGILVCTSTDTVVTGPHAGIRIMDPTARLDNFEMGTL